MPQLWGRVPNGRMWFNAEEALLLIVPDSILKSDDLSLGR